MKNKTKQLLTKDSKFHETKVKSEFYSKVRHGSAITKPGNASQDHSLIRASQPGDIYVFPKVIFFPSFCLFPEFLIIN